MKLIIVVIVSLIALTKGANILYVSNVPSPSHFIWCKALLYSLQEKGHNLTILSPDVEEPRENVTFLHLDQIYPAIYNGSKDYDFFEMTEFTPWELFKLYAEISELSCEAAVNSKGYKQILQYPDNFQVDLVVYDFTMGNCILGILSKFNLPNIVAVTPYISQLSASPTFFFPSLIPGHDLLYSVPMTYTERLHSFIVHMIEVAFNKYYITSINEKILRKVHPNMPALEEIERKIKLYLINTQPITDYKVPTFPNQKPVGGVQIKAPKPLPAELKSIADSAKNGLVLFSLGTNVRSDKLGNERIATILKAFERLPQYTFLWKFETKEKLPMELPKNVKIQAWMPQNDLLAHTNTKLFMSHCGLLSTQEALWYGVPVLGFPVFADQPQNSLRLKDLGVGETLSVLNVSEDELYDTIKNMLENPRYLEIAKRTSKALRDKPMTPNEEATYWTEWVLRNPDIDLEGPAKDMNVWIRLGTDSFLTIFAVVLLILYIDFKITIFLIKLFFNRNSKQVDGKKKRN